MNKDRLESKENRNTGHNEDKDRRYWIFQSNIDLYDLSKALHQCPHVHWKVNNCKPKIGDCGYFYQQGDSPGIYGKGKVQATRQNISPHDCEKGFYTEKGASLLGKKERVNIEIIMILNSPLTEQTIIGNTILKRLSNLKKPEKSRRPIGSCFSVSRDQAKELDSLIMAANCS